MGASCPAFSSALPIGTVDWSRLDTIIARFENACWSGNSPEIEDFLPLGPGPERHAVLRELVLADQELRGKAGEIVPSDRYLERFPELATDIPFVHRLRRSEHAESQEISRQAKVEEVPRVLSRFTLLEEVGRGGFGVVFRAVDPHLRRTVALKIPRPEHVCTTATTERFLREARNAARLRHPGLVAVHDAGQVDGLPYLVTEFIDGPTLGQRLAEGPLPPAVAAELLAAVTEALEHVHEAGIIHRDLKPSNILLDQDDRPHLADFGLALSEPEDATPASRQLLLGTPAYMSPEQARGEPTALDARSDIFSMGVILYQALTGERPFRGHASLVLHQIECQDPRPPRQLNPRVPRDLETICLKALAKVPAQRYSTASELAADLRRWLRGEPILARRVGAMRRLVHYARRRPALCGLALPLALLLPFAVPRFVWNHQESFSQGEHPPYAVYRVGLITNRLAEALDSESPASDEHVLQRNQKLQLLLSQFSGSIESIRTNAAQERDLSWSASLLVNALSHAHSERDARLVWKFTVGLGENFLGQGRRETGLRLLRTGFKKLAKTCDQANRWSEAIPNAENALRWTQVAVNEHSVSPLELAEAWLNLSRNRCEAGDLEGALADVDRGLAILRKPPIKDDMERRRRELFVGLMQRGRILDRLDRWQEAAVDITEAAALAEAVDNEDPAGERGRHRLGLALHVLGRLYYFDLKDPARAVEVFRRAEASRESLARDFPQDATYREELAGTRKYLAEALAALPRP